MPERKANRLAREKSPYLLEHAYNPVAWYPWGDDAFRKAKNDGKPILLSIGYSSCHWCHRMREESFEDERTAALINSSFIPVKVDREERPEVDSYYMAAVQALTGGGGWPLTVFLTPELKPFYGGTYFPPEERFGLPSFRQVLEFVSKLWKEKGSDVSRNAEELASALTRELGGGVPGDVGATALDEGFASAVSSFDESFGGFGRAPKFPMPFTSLFLLRYHYRTGKELAKTAVTMTLQAMMRGGIRDHLGGGFHRYSTDRGWLVPHFEKMLYDNALLARVYAEAYRATGNARFMEVAVETAAWMEVEMRSGGGGLYSSQDADTSSGEGAYYTWTPGEVQDVLGPADAVKFCRDYGVTSVGNFGGRTILHLEGGGSVPAELKARMYKARLKRERPSTDTKVLTSWNGLAISGLAAVATATGDLSHAEPAEGAAEFVLRNLTKDGGLLRRHAGGEAALDGTLFDYAYFVQGLIDLFEVTGTPIWLREALALAGKMVEDFEDKQAGGFFLTPGSVPARMKGGSDGPLPSGNSAAAIALLRLSEITGRDEFRGPAEKAVRAFGREVSEQPASHANMLIALDLIVNGSREVVLTSKTQGGVEPMKRALALAYAPDAVVLASDSQTYKELSELTTLLEGRRPGQRAKAYVCRGFSCGLPAGTPAEMVDQLRTKSR